MRATPPTSSEADDEATAPRCGRRASWPAPAVVAAADDHGDGAAITSASEREEPEEHAADVAHVRPLALVEDRRARDLDVEVRRADDEVAEDGVGRHAQVGVA